MNEDSPPELEAMEDIESTADDLIDHDMAEPS